MTAGSNAQMLSLKTFSLLHFFCLLLQSLPSLCCPESCNCLVGQQVNCTARRLWSVPKNIGAGVAAIYLAWNEITVVGPIAFRGQEGLRRVELQHNSISLLNGQAFVGLQSLQYLDLSFNQIRHLKTGTFSPLTSLTTLNLGNNLISTLESGVPPWLPSIKELFLHNNDLRALDIGVLQELPPSAWSFRLDGNPWSCTCQIQPLWRWMGDNENKIQEKEDIRCGLPGNNDQYPVLDIKESDFHHCQDNLKEDYLFVILIGLALFLASVASCFMTALTVVAYQRLLFKYKTRPHIYKKKTGAYENRIMFDELQLDEQIRR